MIDKHNIVYTCTCTEFTTIFKCNIHKLVKPKTRFVKSKIMPPWLDEEVRNLIKIRDHLKDKEKWKDYKRERNLVTNMIKKKKKSHFKNLVKNSKSQNTKPLWEALNLKSKNPHSVCSSDITADVMNEHFSTVASKLCSKFVKDGFPSQVNSNQYAIKGKLLLFKNFSPAASVCFYLKEVLSNKSTGPDGISVQMRKHCLI
mgnify:CR=1 FL=1